MVQNRYVSAKAHHLIRHRWKKGESGNPGGRPKGIVVLVREMTNDGEKLVNTMMKIMDDNGHPCLIPLVGLKN